MRRLLQDASLSALLGLAGCAAAPEPSPLEPLAHARWAVHGFRDASPWVAERLDRAAAWAVFADVEDPRDPCVHEGRLFIGDTPPRPVFLRCRNRPGSPSGASGHLLVVLEDPSDVARLERGSLDLADAPLLSVHDEAALVELEASRWLVSTSGGSLLFGPSSHPAPRLGLQAD